MPLYIDFHIGVTDALMGFLFGSAAVALMVWGSYINPTWLPKGPAPASECSKCEIREQEKDGSPRNAGLITPALYMANAMRANDRAAYAPDPKPLKERIAALRQYYSPLFRFFPLEVRRQIYSHLLISGTPILVGKTGLVNRKLPSVEGPKPILNLHPKILRVCQDIYTEAHPVLYHENTFHFASPSEIYQFRTEDLPSHNSFSLSPYRSTMCGRLLTIRKVSLLVGACEGIGQGRQGILWTWRDFVVNNYRWDNFPNIGVLSLDFSPWILSDEVDLELNAFIERFQQLGEGRIQQLTVKGVKHQPTLDDMMKRFLLPGGRLIIEE